MDAPAHQVLHQLFHAPQGSDPASVDALLAVHDVGGGVEGHVVALADHGHLAPLAGAADRHRPGGVVGGAIDGAFAAVALGDLHDLLFAFLYVGAVEHVVRQAQVLGQLHAVLVHVTADGSVAAHGLRQHQRGQAHRAKAGDQHPVVAGNADLHQGLVAGAEAAGHLRAVLIGQLVGQGDQVLLVAQHVGGHAAVALPAVGRAVGALAGDVVAAPAIVANAAAGDVVHDHAVALLEALQALALFHDDAAGLVAGDHAGLVALGALAHVGAVDAADVAAADGGSLGLYQHLAMARLGNVKLLQLDGAVARKNRAKNLFVHDEKPPCVFYTDNRSITNSAGLV